MCSSWKKVHKSYRTYKSLEYYKISMYNNYYYSMSRVYLYCYIWLGLRFNRLYCDHDHAITKMIKWNCITCIIIYLILYYLINWILDSTYSTIKLSLLVLTSNNWVTTTITIIDIMKRNSNAVMWAFASTWLILCSLLIQVVALEALN